MKRIYLLFSAVLGLVLALTACGSSGSSGGHDSQRRRWLKLGGSSCAGPSSQPEQVVHQWGGGGYRFGLRARRLTRLAPVQSRSARQRSRRTCSWPTSTPAP